MGNSFGIYLVNMRVDVFKKLKETMHVHIRHLS